MTLSPLPLSDPLGRLLSLLPPKERARVNEAVDGLHHTNHRLWLEEDAVRADPVDTVRIADGKRAIDQLNMDRVRFAERLDELIGAVCPPVTTTASLHTEPISSVIDRLSVTMLRLHHTQLVAADDPNAGSRVAGVQEQVHDLRESLTLLAEDVATGRRRLPSGKRFKLYGTTFRTDTRPIPSPNLPRIIALGGMSECGKSTSGMFLNRDEEAARFKIGYLLTQAAARHGLADPYALSPTRQAELLLDELNRFADAHPDIELITIESVHRAESITALKEMTGERLRVVYIDVPLNIRLERSGGDRRALEEKDRVKSDRGADRIPADEVVDNSGSVARLRGNLWRMARPAISPRLKIISPEDLRLPFTVRAATSRLVDLLSALSEERCLAALTGSAVNGGWHEGWSDIDLLVIAEDEHGIRAAQTVEEYRAELEELGGIHLGATILPLVEAQVRRLPSRVLAALVMLQEGAPALLAGPALRLPVITRREVERDTSAALAEAVATTRRLRHDPGRGGIRPLYKHLVLICRLLLREQSVWVNGNDDVVSEAQRLLPGLGRLDLPELPEVIAAHRNGTDRAAVLGAIVTAVDQLLAWYRRQCAA
ncbi:DUF4254 domain-containing protein [Nocardiopsis kunsanensis]|uniref:DUF4254 domain-containing protein n=1 Tax=Nocardiopsis kunsanensis TaxID=141693 RepID=UPI00034ACD19|nr:DUF4254 domain-containing protein [Nocardiopsis kunsanensis]